METAKSLTPLSLDPKRNGAFGDSAAPAATPAAVVDPTSGQTINTATGQPALDPAQQEATMAAQGEAQSAQLQVQSAEQQAQAATQQAKLESQKKDLEIQQARQAADAANAAKADLTQQLKTQEQHLATVSKQQPAAPQLSPAVTDRVNKVVKSVKPMDNSALMSMKLAAAPQRARGYQGGHDFKTRQLLDGARGVHNAKAPRTATAEEMRPHQQYKGQDWSNYRPRDNADPRDLSGTNGVSYGPGYMENINAGRDRVLSRGADPSAFGVTPVAPAPSPTAQPAAGGAAPFSGGAPGAQAPAYPTPGTPEYEAAVKLRARGSDDFQAAQNGPGHMGYRSDGTWGLITPGGSGQPAAPAPTPAPAPTATPAAAPTPVSAPAPAPTAAPSIPVATPVSAPPQPAPSTAPPVGNDPAADPTLFPPTPTAAPSDATPVDPTAAADPTLFPPAPSGGSTPQSPTYDPATDPAVTTYTNPASSPAAVPTPPATPEPTRTPIGPPTGFSAPLTDGEPTFNTAPPAPKSPGLEGLLKGLNLQGAGASNPTNILPPGNPLGLPPAMMPPPGAGDDPWGSGMESGQLSPEIQQLLAQLLGRANSGDGYQPLGSLGGGYKSATAPPKPTAPQPAGPKIKSFDHGNYQFTNPEATKVLSNPATPLRDQSWAYDQAARDYFAHQGAGTHDQAADYFTSQYPGQETGQHIAERVRQLSNDQTRQQHRQDEGPGGWAELAQGPGASYANTWNNADPGLWGKTKSVAALTSPLMPLKAFADTALGGWRDWTGTADQELQDKLIPQPSRYGSLSNMTSEQQQQMLATGREQAKARAAEGEAWNHRWMGDQEDMGAALSNLYGGFFEQGAPTPSTPGNPDPLMNPWASYWNQAQSPTGKALAGATMLSGLPIAHALATSPTVLKHALGDGQMTAQMAARSGGDALDAFNQFSQGNWREGAEESRNALISGGMARLNAQLLTPVKELATRAPFYAWLGADAFQPGESRGAAIDRGAYEGGAPGTAGAASPGAWSDLTTGAGNYFKAFQQPDPEAKPNAAAPLLQAATALTGVGPSVLGGNKAQIAPVPANIQAQIAPTAGEAAGGSKAIGDAIATANATGAEPGSSSWIQILTLLLPFLAPMFARMGWGDGGDGSLAGSSTAKSYYGPEAYGGTV